MVVMTSWPCTLTTGFSTLITARPWTGFMFAGATAVAGATAGCFAGSGFFAWASAAVVRARNAGTSSHTKSGARFMSDLLEDAVSDRGALRLRHDTANLLDQKPVSAIFRERLSCSQDGARHPAYATLLVSARIKSKHLAQLA